MKKEKLNKFCDIFRNQKSSKDIIFLHGFTSNKNYQESVARDYANNNPDYDVIQCDDRGHGVRKNEGNRLDWEGSTEDIKKIIQERDRETVLIGHSLGGTIALTIGSDIPKVSKVFAVGAAYGNLDFIEEKKRWYKRVLGVSDKEVEEQFENVKPMLPSLHDHCHKSNKNKFYLIHATNDGIVPFSEFQENKKALCLPDENTLVYDNIQKLKISRFDLNHIMPFYDKKTKNFIQSHLDKK